MNYPRSYKQLKATTNIHTHSENKKLLMRFVYRYRLTKSFSEFVAEGIGKTLKGYNAIFKVFLAYKAYEQLLKGASGLRVYELGSLKNNHVVDVQLASRLRMNEKLINSLIEYSTDSRLIYQLAAFRNAQSEDIICVIYAIRNVFAHGDLTSTSIGLALKNQRTTLLDLADLLLNYCDDNFTKCVEKLR
jgi:hypothetical protein